MIWGIIAIIAGLILRAKAVVLIPFVYLLARKDKDLGLIAYFFYTVALIGEVTVSDLLSLGALKAFLLGAFPALMVLREILTGKVTVSKIKRSLDPVVISFVVILLSLGAFLKVEYSYIYTAENQVAIMTGLTLLFVLLMLRDLRKVDMFK
ncbi:hypothetical protein A3L12_02830 [Thermococcus sp. P6]|uniref:hypothetical protein n=1 Tax=Thermococcus sp. P6 TaxID=122420 RepID=UPI000B59EB94|nr:hypothetical protein [Thermococcus sp. P6]ASJ10304.1 hypothetical protein A3L12_02830 [Thermococcus sp. P6]